MWRIIGGYLIFGDLILLELVWYLFEFVLIFYLWGEELRKCLYVVLVYFIVNVKKYWDKLLFW